jgi:hypothetical protein
LVTLAFSAFCPPLSYTADVILVHHYSSYF